MSSYKYVHIATPLSISYVGKIVPVRVDAPVGTQQVSFKLYHEQTNSWTKEIKLVYDASQDSWILPQQYLKLGDGNYYFRTYMYGNNGKVITESLSFAINAPLKIFNFGDSLPGSNSNFELIAFTGFFSIGLLSSIMAINIRRIKNKVSRILKKRDQEQSNR